MPHPKNPPPAAEHAARLVALLTEPAGARRTVEALAAQHRARMRPVKAGRSSQLTGPARPVARLAPPSERYAPDGPTGARVFDAFLNELPGAGVERLREADIARFPDARLAMLLFDAARRYLPRMASAAGDPAAAMELLPLVDPSPEARDPHLYTRAAAKAGGDIGDIARDFEAQRALLAEGRGDRALARCILAALAGRLVARASELLGPHVFEDVARALDDARVQRRRAPVRRSEAASPAARRRPASKTG